MKDKKSLAQTLPYFFDTPSSRLATARTSAKFARQLKLRQDHGHHLINSEQKNVLKHSFNGEIAYTVQKRPPHETVKKGGLEPGTKELFISHSGYNHGAVRLSLLPEAPCIMHQRRTPNQMNYLYALALHGDFFIVNGQWRQVISPGGLVLPSWWRCRSIYDHGNQIELGPMVGQDGETPVKFDETYTRYLNATLPLPHAYNEDQSEDYPLEFTFKDSPFSAQIQRLINRHYTWRHSENNATEKPDHPGFSLT